MEPWRGGRGREGSEGETDAHTHTHTHTHPTWPDWDHNNIQFGYSITAGRCRPWTSTSCRPMPILYVGTLQMRRTLGIGVSLLQPIKRGHEVQDGNHDTDLGTPFALNAINARNNYSGFREGDVLPACRACGFVTETVPCRCHRTNGCMTAPAICPRDSCQQRRSITFFNLAHFFLVWQCLQIRCGQKLFVLKLAVQILKCASEIFLEFSWC